MPIERISTHLVKTVRCPIFMSYRTGRIENVRLNQIAMTDCAGDAHGFHFRTCLLGTMVALDAFELKHGEPAGYQFQIIGDPEEEPLSLLGRLVERMRRRLSVKHLIDSEHGLQIADSIEWRVRRLAAPDMLSTDAAADLLKTTRVTINNWVRDRRCLTVEGPTRGRKLLRWQFAPTVFEHLPKILAALGEDASGWMQLLYFETPSPALGSRSPRQALESRPASPRRRIW